MTDAHWEIVHFIHAHYDLYQCVPENRTLLKPLRERHGREAATDKYIHELFAYGFGQQARKIAGMRKPLKLLLDLRYGLARRLVDRRPAGACTRMQHTQPFSSTRGMSSTRLQGRVR